MNRKRVTVPKNMKGLFCKRTAVLVLALVLVCFGSIAANSRIVIEKNATGSISPHSFLRILAHSWEQGDQKVLSELIHPNGVKINSGAGRERETDYSPSQAYYFFQNLFQRRATLNFSFSRIQNEPSGDLAHGLATWEYKTRQDDTMAESKLVFVLTKYENTWRVVEINTIR